MKFYNNLNAKVPGLRGVVEIERIYCFDWDAFTDAHWQELTGIYDALPGSLRQCSYDAQSGGYRRTAKPGESTIPLQLSLRLMPWLLTDLGTAPK